MANAVKVQKINGFQSFDGRDKRDRTAGLLNAIDLSRLRNGIIYTKQTQKTRKTHK